MEDGTEAERAARFVALVTAHEALLRSVIGGYARGAEDRRDLRQDIHLQLWRAFPRYDPARRFSTWMYRVALNVAISRLRRVGPEAARTVSLEAGDGGGPDPEPADPRATPRAPDAMDARAHALRGFMERLAPLERALLLLYLDELSHAEIAEVLGISASNVGTKIHRLKQRIRVELADPPSP